MEYALHLIVLICIYVILAQSLNLSAGMARLISLTHAGWYGCGAYTTALLSLKLGWPYWINLPVAILVTALIATGVSVVALRTVEDYFVVCTLASQILIYSVMNNWIGLTSGPFGLPDIPSIRIFAFDIREKWAFSVLALCFCLIIHLVNRNIMASAFGRLLRAIREDEVLAKSIGKNVYQAKLRAFTMGAVIAAVAGTLYAHFATYIDPSSFTVDESILILSMAIVGGIDSVAGVTVGAALMVLFPEALRFVGLPSSAAANLRQILFGALLVIIMMARPRGLFGRHGFGT